MADKTPMCEGRVTIHTSFGRVDVELWTRQAPQATRNFLQHAVDQYYDGCIFHRVVPGFLVQTGDPSGTGAGGASIYEGGKAFATESHPQLRFRHRGIVAMAGEDGDNRSQFFITLAEAPHLDGKYTIIGRVLPETIYPILSVADLPCRDERPIDPPKITSITVEDNPFDDMVARARPAPAADKIREDKDKRPAKKRKGVNNKALLSMADEWDALEEGFDAQEGILSTHVKGSRVVSAHDLMESEHLHKASVHTAERKREIKRMNEEFERKHGARGGGADARTEKLKRRMARKRKRGDDGDDAGASADSSSEDTPFVSRKREESDAVKAAKAAELAQLREEQQRMKDEINRFKTKAGEDVSLPKQTGPKSKGLLWLEEQRARYARPGGGRPRGRDSEKETVLKLMALRKTLRKEQVVPEKAPAVAATTPAAVPEVERAPAVPTKTATAMLPGEADVSMTYAEEATTKGGEGGGTWFKEALTFANPQADTGNDTTIDDGYKVEDPAPLVVPQTTAAGRALAATREQTAKMVMERKRRVQQEKARLLEMQGGDEGEGGAQ